MSYDHRRRPVPSRRIVRRYDSEAIRATEALYELANSQALSEEARLDAVAQIDAIYLALSKLQTTREIMVCGACGKPWSDAHRAC